MFVWFVPSTRIFQTKAVNMMLWSVYCLYINFVRRPQHQEDPSTRDKYNPLHVNQIHETYGDRMIHLQDLPGTIIFPSPCKNVKSPTNC